MWDNASGVEYHRIIKPLQRLFVEDMLGANELEIVKAANISKAGVPDLRDFDLVVFNRDLGIYNEPITQYLAKEKIPFVLDVDDYWKLPKFHPAYDHYKKGLGKRIVENLRYADGVTCSTEYLAQFVRPLNKNVCVLPNALDETHEQWNQPKVSSDKFRVGYLGGATHANDALIIGDAMKEIGEGIEFFYCGFTETPESRSMLKRLGATPVEAKTPEEYGKMFASLDLVLAPLENSTYNNCKSDIKVQEAQAYGIPIICSDVPPYQEHQFSLGVTLVNNDPESWRQAILDAKGQETAPMRSLVEVNRKRLEFYKSCVHL